MPDPIDEPLDLNIDTHVELDGVLSDAVGNEPLPLLSDSDPVSSLEPRKRRSRGIDIRPNRESDFERDLARFRDPDTGQIERGSPPPDLDTDVGRYRGKDGRFKKSSSDLFDEPAEVRENSLEPPG